MPQVLKGVRHLDQHAEALLQRPELAAMLGVIAAQWTRIENRLAELFVGLLEKEASAALDIYLEIIKQDVRKDAFNAVARSKLDDKSFKAFQDLFKKVKKKSRERNKFIRGIWAISDEHKDGILLIDYKEYHKEDFKLKHAKFKSLQEKADYVNELIKRSKMTKYKKEDFQDTIQRLLSLEEDIFVFRCDAKFVSRQPSTGTTPSSHSP